MNTDIKTVPKEVSRAYELAREKDYIIISGGDLNARNTLYGSSVTDSRGSKIEELSIHYDLAFAENLGKRPTCTASHPGSVIDATIVSGEHYDLIKNWRVKNIITF